MADQTPRTTGSFVVNKKTRPAVEVDCSGWADTSGGGWTFGNFVTQKTTRPAIEVDCSDWGKEPFTAWMELVVSFDAAARPAAFLEHTNRLVAAAKEVAPDLGLKWDAERSWAEGDDVVVVLIPSGPAAGARGRLDEVAEVIGRATRVAVRVKRRKAG